MGQVPVRSNLPEKWDLLFEPLYARPDVTIFAQKVNCSMKEILMRNDTDRILVIFGKATLGRVVEYKADECYKAHINTICKAPINLQRSALHDFMAFDSLAESNKTVLDNRTICYRDHDTVGKLAGVAKQFKPSL